MSQPTPTLVCLLAGHGSRMGQPKQHAVIAGRTFLAHIIATLDALAFAGQRTFVGQDGDNRSAQCIANCGGTWITNPRPEDGPLSSIRLALPTVPAGSGILLWPIDAPLVRPATVAALLAAAQASPDRFAIPSDGRRRGHPAFFPGWALPEIERAPLDQGARWVLQQHPHVIDHLVVDDPWITANINTPSALAEAEARRQREAR